MNKYVFNKKWFTNRIKSAREKKNLTQEQLSNILNLDISKIESEDSELTLSYTNLVDLANILDISIDYLFLNEEIKIFQDNNNFNNLISKLTEREKTIIATIIEALINNR